MGKRLWAEGSLQGNDSYTWFEESPSETIATYHAIPIVQGIYGTGVNGIPRRYYPDYDQIVKITDVFVVAKGDAHLRDGSGGQGDLQVNVTIANLTANPANYQIWVWD